MPFDETTWRQRLQVKLQSLGHWLNQRRQRDVPYIAYGALTTLTLWPLIEAAGAALQSGQSVPASLYIALGNIAGSVGGNLIAAQIARWKDHADQLTEDEVADWVVERATDDAQYLAAFDQMLARLDVLPAAQQHLEEERRDWFVATLRRETQTLGSALAQVVVTLTAIEGHSAATADNTARAAAALDKLAAPPDPVDAATRAYLERLISECNDMPDLVALGIDNADLRFKLDRLYIPLDIRDPVSPDAMDATERLLGGDRDRRAPALAAIAQSDRVVLLGDPGSGKSLFVRHLATQLALAWLGRADPPAGWQPRIPLLLTVRLLGPRLARLNLNGLSAQAQRQALRDALFEQWREELAQMRRAEFAEHLDAVLGRGNTVLIFDGLDEIGSAVRPLLYRAIQALAVWYDRLPHIIVTCRIRSYPTENPARLLLPGYRTHTLAPFTPDQIDEFIQRWYRLAAPGDVADRLQDLQRNAKRPDLIKLAENPLLLTAMAVVHQKRAKLPDQRVKIYAEVVDILLVRWQKTRNLPVSAALTAVLENHDGRDRVLKSMERLGYEAHCLLEPGADNADLTRDAARAILQEPGCLGDGALAAEFLDYVDQRAGLLIGRGGDDAFSLPAQYAFPHRTFLEYLAGCYLLKDHLSETKRAYSALAAAKNDWSGAAQLGAEELLYNRRNEGGALELAYHLIPLEEPVNTAGRRGVVWAGHIAVLVGRRKMEQDAVFQGATHLRRLRAQLTSIVTQPGTLPLQQRAEAGRSLGQLGDERVGVGWVERDGLKLPDIAWGEIVPAGRYTVGGDSQAYGSFEKRTATIAQAYQLARYPVTYAQFQCFIEAPDVMDARWWRGMPEAGKDWDGRVYRVREWGEQAFKFDNHPREMVSWYQAVAFCRWLSDKLGYDVDLPTEDEWEVAARYPDGRFYPWGNKFDPTKANTSESGIGQTSAVGIFPEGANPALGLYDLSGNVWEWCRNKYSYPADTTVDDSGAARTLRGGSWADYRSSTRAACRSVSAPDDRDGGVGLRGVRRLPSH